jgi:SNF2 family DNA or RNA helicase
MRIIPRDFQLKAAAQGLYCLDSPMKLFLLGDEMGVGKTLTAILMMWAKKDLPGMSIVICPKSVCRQWERATNDAFDNVRS